MLREEVVVGAVPHELEKGVAFRVKYHSTEIFQMGCVKSTYITSYPVVRASIVCNENLPYKRNDLISGHFYS